MDEVLPDYIKERKTKFEDARERMGEAGLLIPPDFDGVYFSDDERLEHLLEKPSFPGRKPLRKYEDIIIPTTAGVIPASHAQWLRDYQVKGVEFLHEKFVYQRGGILGDDMGLGKTIQVIAFLTAAFGKTGDERDQKRMRKMRQNDRDYPRALIICPGTLLENWKSELNDWGWWHIYTYHGSPADKDAALRAARRGRAEVVLTTYTTYRNNRSEINTVDWDCVIADECHIIKSRASEITKAMNEINALCRIGLTGTAIQNNYYELWTLLNWTNPGRFGGVATWKYCISDPLKMGQAHDATYQQLAKARKTAKSLVNNLLPQFFLRRMKSLIAHELPKKSDRVGKSKSNLRLRTILIASQCFAPLPNLKLKHMRIMSIVILSSTSGGLRILVTADLAQSGDGAVTPRSPDMENGRTTCFLPWQLYKSSPII